MCPFLWVHYKTLPIKVAKKLYLAIFFFINISCRYSVFCSKKIKIAKIAKGYTKKSRLQTSATLNYAKKA